MTKHNLDNPKCPDCGGISHKTGFLPLRSGKVQRWVCINCGRSFTENTMFVKIEDIAKHLERVL